jgi:peptidyl-tRNA hydrolase, PTH1 family
VFLVVGLGNPGRAYETHRHNVGFRVVDAIRERQGWPEYKAKFSGVWTRGLLGARPVSLLKPQGYMNLSGDSVQPAAAFLKVAPEGIIVVHDELDLAWRDIRVKVGGGHAGHNGVRSIIERLGSAAFVRVRVGIGSPGRGGRDAADWVLSSFEPVEREALPEVLAEAVRAVESIVELGPAAAMNRVNVRTLPASPDKIRPK